MGRILERTCRMGQEKMDRLAEIVAVLKNQRAERATLLKAYNDSAKASNDLKVERDELLAQQSQAKAEERKAKATAKTTKETVAA